MKRRLCRAKHDSVRRRVSTCELFTVFCEETELDASLYRVDWVRQLVTLLDDREVSVHTAAWNSFDMFVKSIPKDELESLVVPLRRTIESTGGPGIYVPGFGLPKGVSPTVPIIIAGLTTGSNEQREQAAYAIGDLVERTEESAIKPFVVPFTGPLIRVATQAATYPPAVKTAILSALTTMLDRIPTFVKPFFPQLQRTFVKSASDSASLAVRIRAARALGVLMKNQPRVDPVVTELVTGAKSNEDTIAASLVLALALVVRSAGSNVGEKAREACAELISESFREPHEGEVIWRHGPRLMLIVVYRFLLSIGWGVVCVPLNFRGCCETYHHVGTYHSEPQRYTHVSLLPSNSAHLVAGTPQSVVSSHCIRAVLSSDEDDDHHDGPNVFQKLGILRKVAQKVQESAGNEKPSIARPAREAREALKALGDDVLQVPS